MLSPSFFVRFRRCLPLSVSLNTRICNARKSLFFPVAGERLQALHQQRRRQYPLPVSPPAPHPPLNPHYYPPFAAATRLISTIATAIQSFIQVAALRLQLFQRLCRLLLPHLRYLLRPCNSAVRRVCAYEASAAAAAAATAATAAATAAAAAAAAVLLRCLLSPPSLAPPLRWCDNLQTAYVKL